MSEDAELQKRIAEISGLINREKQQNTVYRPSATTTSRWAPYNTTRHRGRGAYKPSSFRNRTLVNKNNAEAAKAEPSAPAKGGVTTHDRGRMQWTNATVYEKKAQEKIQAITETTSAKLQAKEAAQKNKVLNHVYGQNSGTSTPSQAATPREIIINDLRFRVATDGSKLIRIFGETSGRTLTNKILNNTDGPDAAPHTTPKETKVAGVTFVRTKHGNMVRRGLLKTKRCSHYPGCGEWNHSPRIDRTVAGATQKKLCPDFTSTGNVQLHSATHNSIRDDHESCRQCSILTLTTGSCTRGNRCKYRHDVEKLAMCKDFLRHGQCAAGEDCNLSHDPTPHRVPTCLHFLRNACTKPDCRYSHVLVDAAAPVCKDFARLGYCDRGSSCAHRHVSECPDYTNTGTCRDSKCRLPHIDRAGTLRKAAKKASGDDGDDVSFDVSSDEGEFDEIDSDDADSDEDVVMVGGGDGGRELSQQDDFVSFS